MGLKFAMYEDAGNLTCAGYPGSQGSFEIDTKTFADWNIDYLKLDGCWMDIDQMPDGYAEFGRLLNTTGRPIVYSCSWPAYLTFMNMSDQINYTQIGEHCNLWRNFDDVQLHNNWTSLISIIDWYTENQDRMAQVHGPGKWNDPDMVG
ncbi:alpha galactosidase A domain-containing protein [Ditylenchus destructor]|uniref:Alpha-galactosidase n=1 Tax=Ditylenchus destructor TaxID=166010 RepID=A0AAD4MJX5_9BILA|nr:alpha galactosidase A domain-containing protein [Ditylenchus destructor]